MELLEHPEVGMVLVYANVARFFVGGYQKEGNYQQSDEEVDEGQL